MLIIMHSNYVFHDYFPLKLRDFNAFTTVLKKPRAAQFSSIPSVLRTKFLIESQF